PTNHEAPRLSNLTFHDSSAMLRLTQRSLAPCSPAGAFLLVARSFPTLLPPSLQISAVQRAPTEGGTARSVWRFGPREFCVPESSCRLSEWMLKRPARGRACSLAPHH